MINIYFVFEIKWQQLAQKMELEIGIRKSLAEGNQRKSHEGE